MATRIKYSIGQELGEWGIVYMGDAEPYIRKKQKTISRAANFLCKCGNIYRARIIDVRMGKSKSCGCEKGAEMFYYNRGEIINGIKFLRSIGTVNKAQYAIFECPICGNDWISSIANVKHGNSKSCCNSLLIGEEKWCALTNKLTLYKAVMFDENESFVKIGITSRSADERLREFPYNYTILKTIVGDTRYIVRLEKRINNMFVDKKYTPMIKFSGYTECFTNN